MESWMKAQKNRKISFAASLFSLFYSLLSS
jgi:hypothetical protein